jgi:hypothetical protein
VYAYIWKIANPPFIVPAPTAVARIRYREYAVYVGSTTCSVRVAGGLPIVFNTPVEYTKLTHVLPPSELPSK